jgi:hypothetical protein
VQLRAEDGERDAHGEHRAVGRGGGRQAHRAVGEPHHPVRRLGVLARRLSVDKKTRGGPGRAEQPLGGQNTYTNTFTLASRKNKRCTLYFGLLYFTPCPPTRFGLRAAAKFFSQASSHRQKSSKRFSLFT